MDLEFVQTNVGSERTWQRSKLRKTPVIRFKDYDVFATFGDRRVKIGRVFQGLATFERRTPGRMYVNSRWESPRWYFEIEGSSNSHTYRSPQDTRRGAVQCVVEDYERLHVL